MQGAIATKHILKLNIKHYHIQAISWKIPFKYNGIVEAPCFTRARLIDLH